MRAALAAWRDSVRAQVNTPNPDFNPDLYRQLYVDLDVSRYDGSTADAALHERLLSWRRTMNAVLPRAR
jgi:hypothetical protein